MTDYRENLVDTNFNKSNLQYFFFFYLTEPCLPNQTACRAQYRAALGAFTNKMNPENKCYQLLYFLYYLMKVLFCKKFLSLFYREIFFIYVSDT